MKIKLTTNKITPTDFVKRAFFLLYQACGREYGMGVLQTRRGATEEDIWSNVCIAGDYAFNGPVERTVKDAERGEYYGDYVFGRMIKWGCKVKDGIIEFHDREFSPDYQGFAHKYPDALAVIAAVLDSFGLKSDSYQKVEETKG